MERERNQDMLDIIVATRRDISTMLHPVHRRTLEPHFLRNQIADVACRPMSLRVSALHVPYTNICTPTRLQSSRCYTAIRPPLYL